LEGVRLYHSSNGLVRRTRPETLFRAHGFLNDHSIRSGSPRARQEDAYGNFGYPFTNTTSGNTPERFKEALQMPKIASHNNRRVRRC
jgi:hypothetical protein